MLSNWNIVLWKYDFLAPHYFWLLLLIPFFYWFLIWQDRRSLGDMFFSNSMEKQELIASNTLENIRKFIFLIYTISASLLILALANPYRSDLDEDRKSNSNDGIDIVITMDISGSMLARDFAPNRIEAAKLVAKEFIERRKNDRIGMVAYEGEAFTVCPLTMDHEILMAQLAQLQSGILEAGTAIGLGLGTAVNRLKSDSLESKVIILLTDGVNTRGDISPEEATMLAKNKNIKVYTIGVGTRGMALSPEFTPFGIRYVEALVEIDEDLLTQIATQTGGKYFRATDENSLRKIYQEIDLLEKRTIKDFDYQSNMPAMPQAFLNWALLLALIAWSVQLFYFKRNG
jgi:Ca-activated chloride channel family protein